MVSKNYLAPHGPQSSAAKQYFDQRVIPLGINAAGFAESAALRVGQAAARSPVAALMGAILLGSAISAILAARHARRRASRFSLRM